MLVLNGIVKKYYVGDETVEALKGVSLQFRKNEFVSILGPSGCGKTTLLNIIGGLDHYTTGDLIINGKSTKKFKDSDWDTYRNHSIGFVFQSYNLIPHQTVLANVELALTLSGVSKKERRARAIEALNKVGLNDKLYKKPNQMSGGQMQRVAIARALVNDPDIILADEPTGALDSQTSVQVMDILKEVSKEKLIIMVTHNEDLADKYSSRIIKLQDGLIVGDSDPYTEEEQKNEAWENKKANKKRSMSFWTALSLSFNNLMTKKGRTFLTAFAGSIGIIGIALILSLSNGFQNYINKVQEDTLSAYPITIQKESTDLSSLMESLSNAKEEKSQHEADKVYSNSTLFTMMDAMATASKTENNVRKFKSYVSTHIDELNNCVTSITYSYNLNLDVYNDKNDKVSKVNPSEVLEYVTKLFYSSNASSIMSSTSLLNVFSEILPGVNGELISPTVKEQYDVVAGRWPENENELVLVISKDNEISDMALYSLGLKDSQEFYDMIKAWVNQESYKPSEMSWSYDELLDMEFKYIMPSDYYVLNMLTGVYEDKRDDSDAMDIIYNTKGHEIKIAGIIRPSASATSTSISGSVGYTSKLMETYIAQNNASNLLTSQIADPTVDVFTGQKFAHLDDESKEDQIKTLQDYVSNMSQSEKEMYYVSMKSAATDAEIEAYYNYLAYDEATMAQIKGYLESYGMLDPAMTNQEILANAYVKAYIMPQLKSTIQANKMASLASVPNKDVLLDAEMDNLPNLTAEEVKAYYDFYVEFRSSGDEEVATYESNLFKLGYIDLDNPSSISFYPISFEDKDKIADFISDYNSTAAEEDIISYTDYIGALLSGITTIIDAISYVLIGFVSISLVVSSIMIGIITYVSVLERTKEIGILRAVGASKKDISRVFNAETLIVGLIAGAIGVISSILIDIPITLIVQSLTDIKALAATLPVEGGIVLVLISVFLTFIAGLIPSSMAAKKDPVVALRTE